MRTRWWIATGIAVLLVGVAAGSAWARAAGQVQSNASGGPETLVSVVTFSGTDSTTTIPAGWNSFPGAKVTFKIPGSNSAVVLARFSGTYFASGSDCAVQILVDGAPASPTPTALGGGFLSRPSLTPESPFEIDGSVVVGPGRHTIQVQGEGGGFGTQYDDPLYVANWTLSVERARKG